jgi:hypothetical protein
MWALAVKFKVLANEKVGQIHVGMRSVDGSILAKVT